MNIKFFDEAKLWVNNHVSYKELYQAFFEEEPEQTKDDCSQLKDFFKIQDIRITILKHCDIPELIKMSLCSHNWKLLVEEPEVWTNIASKLHLRQMCDKDKVLLYVRKAIKYALRNLHFYIGDHFPSKKYYATAFFKDSEGLAFQQIRKSILESLAPRVECINALKLICNAVDLLRECKQTNLLELKTIEGLIFEANIVPEEVKSKIQVLKSNDIQDHNVKQEFWASQLEDPEDLKRILYICDKNYYLLAKELKVPVAIENAIEALMKSGISKEKFKKLEEKSIFLSEWNSSGNHQL